MDSQVNYMRQRLSLRKPLAKALELTARLTDKTFFAETSDRPGHARNVYHGRACKGEVHRADGQGI